VHDDTEIVRRGAVGSRNDQVIQLGIVETDVAVNLVFDHDNPLERILEANDRIDTWAGLGAMPTSAVVLRLLFRFELTDTHRIELFLRAVAAIRMPLCEELLEHLAIALHALALVEGPLVRMEPKPLHPFENDSRRLVRGALTIGVLDAQDKHTAMPLGIEP